RLTIDGRPGGTGDMDWIFRNTRTAATVAPTFRFINDATENTLTYLQVEGQNITANIGTIFFSTSTSLSLGNSDNTISHCHIRDRNDNATTPLNGIVSVGTNGVPNINNTISNNHIYNFFSASAASYGILIGNYNASWE